MICGIEVWWTDRREFRNKMEKWIIKHLGRVKKIVKSKAKFLELRVTLPKVNGKCDKIRNVFYSYELPCIFFLQKFVSTYLTFPILNDFILSAQMTTPL